LQPLLGHYEKNLAKAYGMLGDKEQTNLYRAKLHRRKVAYNKYHWRYDNDKHQAGFIYDYDFVAGQTTPIESLAAAYGLTERFVSRKRADMVRRRIKERFLHRGGLATTTVDILEQWAGKKGWAPLHDEVDQGLMAYSERPGDKFAWLASEGLGRWLARNKRLFREQGRLTEKINVCDPDILIGNDGEYPPQFGFGWTNGLVITAIRRLRQRGASDLAG
jgi:alpha,alpha-trehalase